ncbi:MAG TPA: Ig-like domain-containing protein, partial [Clostridia bacterium]|nr:Ig-like domain-containing protein [Clostridia bacterium]
SGPGTTGRQWWTTNWSYFFLPDSLKEAFRADGTTFTVVADADIASNALLSNGVPRFPIVISLASEAIADEQIAAFTNYVAAGGFLLVGSSSFTRHTNGLSRGNFAFAAELGLNMVIPGLTNWAPVSNFVKQVEHRIVSHYPAGSLLNRMPIAAEEINWGVSPSHNFQNSHLAWQVQTTDATVLALANGSPYVAVKPFGKGFFIYHAGFQPLVGHGGFAPSMYAYVIFRRALEWAFESCKVPIPRLSPWPYDYDAAFVVRHDFENYTNLIAKIEQSAQFEYTNGAKGDYYFCTGTLREDAAADYDTNAIVAGLRRAVTNYNATIAAHNGGLRNPRNPSLTHGDYDFWHWGPDEALDTSPPSYPDGKTYAFTSMSSAFADVESWLAGLPETPRIWVSCYFNATREDSYDIQQRLGVKVSGEQKLTPFPHWTLSTKTPGKRYSFLSHPVSDWFVVSGGAGQVAQSLEPWRPPFNHNLTSMRQAVDFYYNLGALINIYSHSLSTGEGPAGQLLPEYIRYSLNTNIHPRVWSANAIDLYQWALHRSNAVVTASFSTNGLQSTATLDFSGGTDPATAVELHFPGSGHITALQVLTNGSLAGPDAYRLNNRMLKLRVGTTVTNSVISYILTPRALNDSFVTLSGRTLNLAAPGILTNDASGLGTALYAVLQSPPTNGSLVLSSNGGFSYTPSLNFSGIDAFTYQAHDGLTNSLTATVTILVAESDLLFGDDFTRPAEPGQLSPWLVHAGAWSINMGGLKAGTNPPQSYGNLYLTNSWTNYSAEARIQFPPGAYGGGLGARLNPVNGTHYGAWVYPENSTGGSKTVKLIKFQSWTAFGYTNISSAVMASANLPAVGTNWHQLKLALHTNRIAVYFDSSQLISLTDAEVTPWLGGGVSLDLWTANNPYGLSIDDVLISPLATDESYRVTGGRSLIIPAPGVLTNDTAVYTTTLSAHLLSGPSNGVLDLSANGAFSYSPLPGYSGTDEFTYEVRDGSVTLGTATAIITVLPTGNLPVLPPQPNHIIAELTPLIVTNTATDADLPNDTLQYQLIAPPPGAVIDPSGIITWTPDEAQGPGVYTLVTTVTDAGIPSAIATNSFEVQVTEVNSELSLAEVLTQTINELSLLQVTNTVTDPDLPPNAFTFELLQAPVGAVIAPDGVLSWTPGEAHGPGTNLVVLRATDDGTPPFSVTNSFLIIVNEINSAPEIAAQTNLTVEELSLVQLSLAASDPDLPPNNLSFSLLTGPTNASVSANGFLSWAVAEDQGPSTNLFRVQVTDNGSPSRSATNSFLVSVSEVNSPPTLPVISNRTIPSLVPFSLTNRAIDSDLPANTLTYQLLQAPSNSAISPSGVITWTPAQDQERTTNLFVTIVTDDGVPPFSATNTFSITVKSEPVILLSSALLLSESCVPANNAIDPGEQATLVISLSNAAPGATINLVATLLPTNGVTSPSQPSSYGVLAGGNAAAAQPFSFIATGACGGTITATFALTDHELDLGRLTVSLPLGTAPNILTENFDSLPAPELPSNWSTLASGFHTNWITRTNFADSLPNVAFAASPTNAGLAELISPVLDLAANNARLTFRHLYDLEPGAADIAYDGAALEIRIGTNSFTDILTAGGTFITGGYNRVIHTNYNNPLAGRPAWSGNSVSFITTTVQLPEAAMHQPVQFKWICATDSETAKTGWFLDSIQISGIACCSGAAPPIIQRLFISNDVAHITWTANPGSSYTLQFKSNLLDTTWTDILPQILATNDTASATNSLDASSQRLYRIRAQP